MGIFIQKSHPFGIPSLSKWLSALVAARQSEAGGHVWPSALGARIGALDGLSAHNGRLRALGRQPLACE